MSEQDVSLNSVVSDVGAADVAAVESLSIDDFFSEPRESQTMKKIIAEIDDPETFVTDKAFEEWERQRKDYGLTLRFGLVLNATPTQFEKPRYIRKITSMFEAFFSVYGQKHDCSTLFIYKDEKVSNVCGHPNKATIYYIAIRPYDEITPKALFDVFELLSFFASVGTYFRQACNRTSFHNCNGWGLEFKPDGSSFLEWEEKNLTDLWDVRQKSLHLETSKAEELITYISFMFKDAERDVIRKAFYSWYVKKSFRRRFGNYTAKMEFF